MRVFFLSHLPGLGLGWSGVLLKAAAFRGHPNCHAAMGVAWGCQGADLQSLAPGAGEQWAQIHVSLHSCFG